MGSHVFDGQTYIVELRFMTESKQQIPDLWLDGDCWYDIGDCIKMAWHESMTVLKQIF